MKRKGIIIFIGIAILLTALTGYILFSLSDNAKNERQQFLDVSVVNRLIVKNMGQDSTVNLDYWRIKEDLEPYSFLFDQNELNKIERVVSKYGLEVWGDRRNGILYIYSTENAGLSPKYRICKAYLYFEGNIKDCPKLDWFLELRAIKKIKGSWYQVEYEI